ncbi:HTH-type transcriptional repressor PurR [compost metagenome]
MAALEDSGWEGEPKEELMLALDDNPETSYFEQLRHWAHRLSEQQMQPTALVCANDALAYSVTRVMKEAGLSIPDDVTVTGFDNLEDSAHYEPPLTTVHVPKEMLGKRAVEILLARLRKKQEPHEKLLVAGEIIHRQSAAPPKEL